MNPLKRKAYEKLSSSRSASFSLSRSFLASDKACRGRRRSASAFATFSSPSCPTASSGYNEIVIEEWNSESLCTWVELVKTCCLALRLRSCDFFQILLFRPDIVLIQIPQSRRLNLFRAAFTVFRFPDFSENFVTVRSWVKAGAGDNLKNSGWDRMLDLVAQLTLLVKFDGRAGWIESCEKFLMISDVAGGLILFTAKPAMMRNAEERESYTNWARDRMNALPGRINTPNIAIIQYFRLFSVQLHAVTTFQWKLSSRSNRNSLYGCRRYFQSANRMKVEASAPHYSANVLKDSLSCSWVNL